MVPVEESCHLHSCRVTNERMQEGIAQHSGSSVLNASSLLISDFSHSCSTRFG